MPWREPQGLLTPQIQRLKLTGGKQSCSCGSFEAWVPSLRAVLCVCTMEAWIKQMQELRLKNVAVQHRKLCLHRPHGAPSRPDRAVMAEHSPLRAFSWASLALGLVAPQGKARDILWQFSCRLGLLRGPCTPASPAAPSPSLPPWTWSPQGKHGAQSYCSCVWHPWKGKKTPRKNGRNRKRDTKYGVAKVTVAFLPQRKHEPILQGGAVPGEAQHGHREREEHCHQPGRWCRAAVPRRNRPRLRGSQPSGEEATEEQVRFLNWGVSFFWLFLHCEGSWLQSPSWRLLFL